jgi:small neutral amino acid transporter SnatA (MarC family)
MGRKNAGADRRSSRVTFGLPGELFQVRANKNLFACRIVNNDVLTGKSFCELSHARFGSLKVLGGLNAIAIAVRLLFENVKKR